MRRKKKRAHWTAKRPGENHPRTDKKDPDLGCARDRPDIRKGKKGAETGALFLRRLKVERRRGGDERKAERRCRPSFRGKKGEREVPEFVSHDRAKGAPTSTIEKERLAEQSYQGRRKIILDEVPGRTRA